MKRQTQTTGVRYWFGGDYLSIQEEAFKILDGFFGQFGPHVLTGCQVTPRGDKHDVAPGMVVIEGLNAEGRAAKMIVPFAGASNVTLPIYLTIGLDTESRIYKDGGVKPIVHNYRAVASTVKPAGSCVTITANTTLRFADVIQDIQHRFITDDERIAWNNKENAVAGKGLSTNDFTDEDKQFLAGLKCYDYVVDSNKKLAGLINNPNATNVLIKSGTWSCNERIELHLNTRHIYGEVGNSLNVDGFGYANNRSLDQDYSIKGVNIRIIMAPINASYRGFINMKNMIQCSANILGEYSVAFEGCVNIMQCSGITNGSAFRSCTRLHQCEGTASNKSFDGCYDMVQCVGNASIDSCYSVFQCRARRFPSSYFSSVSNSVYACASTLNGGWNITIYG